MTLVKLMLINERGIWQINPIDSPLFTYILETPIGMTTPNADNTYYVKLYMVINRDYYPQTSIKQGIIGMALFIGWG